VISELAGRPPGEPLENSAELALIPKACRECNLYQRRVGPDELTAGELDSHLSEILTHGTVVILTKYPSEVNGMHPYLGRHLVEAKGLGEGGVETIDHLLKPTGGPALHLKGASAASLDEQFQDEGLHGQWCHGIAAPELLVEPAGEPRQPPTLELGDAVEDDRVFGQPLEPGRPEVQVKAPPVTLGLVGMDLSRGTER
jgi:hypothetical protein